MYIGRIVCVARTPSGKLSALYRVSSRSYPNRMAVSGEDRVAIVPKPGHEADIQRSPYIAYNCVRVVSGGTIAVVTNGSQTDPIAFKIAMGVPVREALASCSLAMDFEHDEYDTPRISAVVDSAKNEAWLATVRNDGLEVQRIELLPGQYAYVATYEENHITAAQTGACDFEDAKAGCEFMFTGGVFAQRTNPVTAVVAVAGEGFVSLHAQDVQAS